jgi:hypothetical protein
MTDDSSAGDRQNRRAETAKQNDDSDIIDATDIAPGHGGRSGGNLQRDVGTQAAAERVRDPEAHEGVTKEDKLQHGTGSVEPKTPDGNSPRGGSGG